jgi:tRNA threonylcarbamoyladenosine biosynthesis protein TsaE
MSSRRVTLAAASEADQVALGSRLAGCLPWPFVVFLEGELGTGKTTLVRGILRGLGHRGNVKSPTYTLIEPYALGERLVYHLDLYRVGDPGELEYLGLRDLLAESSLLLVEWPERGEGELPSPDLMIHIRYAPQGRALSLRAHSAGGEAVLRHLIPPDEESKAGAGIAQGLES